jgi:hypothetical protein
LTDDELFQYKGGIKSWVERVLVGLGNVAGYLAFSGRFIEVARFNLTSKVSNR